MKKVFYFSLMVMAMFMMVFMALMSLIVQQLRIILRN